MSSDLSRRKPGRHDNSYRSPELLAGPGNRGRGAAQQPAERFGGTSCVLRMQSALSIPSLIAETRARPPPVSPQSRRIFQPFNAPNVCEIALASVVRRLNVTL